MSRARPRRPRRPPTLPAAAPPPERAQHPAISGDTTPAVERLTDQIPDANGGIGHPYKIRDTLAALLSRKSISRSQHDAGRRFEDDFIRAQFNLLRAPDISRIPGQTSQDIADASYDARRRVHKAINAVGGGASPPGHIIWHVLGEGITIKYWSEETWRPTTSRYLNEKTGSGILIAALSALAAHYGLLTMATEPAQDRYAHDNHARSGPRRRAF